MTTDPDPTLDDLLVRCRTGSDSAARELFDRYAERLMRLARRRIGTRIAARVDPEDVVQSVFRTFFVRLRDDRFVLADMDDLSRLLVGITVRKTLRQVAFHRAARRDPAAEVGQEGSEDMPLTRVTTAEPTPEAVVVFCDELARLLAKFPPDERAMLELKAEGYSTDEIARKMGTYDRKVRRVIERARALVAADAAALGPADPAAPPAGG